MQISLSAEDREKFGCPEWLNNASPLSLTTREAEALELAGGDHNNWPKPDHVDKLINTRTWIWVVLFRNGVEISFDDCHFDLFLRFRESPGKAPSKRSGTATRSRSGSTPGGKSTRTRSRT